MTIIGLLSHSYFEKHLLNSYYITEEIEAISLSVSKDSGYTLWYQKATYTNIFFKKKHRTE